MTSENQFLSYLGKCIGRAVFLLALCAILYLILVFMIGIKVAYLQVLGSILILNFMKKFFNGSLDA